MRANHRFLRLTAVVAAVQATTVLLAGRAFADPTPTPTGTASPSPTPTDSNNPCDLIRGRAKDYCERGEAASNGSTTLDDPSTTLDPLASLAKGCADAASWTDRASSAGPSRTPRTSTSPTPTFLQQYAVVFAASTDPHPPPLAARRRQARGARRAAHRRALRSHRLPLADRPRLRLHPADPLHRRLRDRRRHRRHRRRRPATRRTRSSARSPARSRRATTSAAGRSC